MDDDVSDPPYVPPEEMVLRALDDEDVDIPYDGMNVSREGTPKQKPKKRKSATPIMIVEEAPPEGLEDSFTESQPSTSAKPSPKRRKTPNQKKKTAPKSIMVVEEAAPEGLEEDTASQIWKKNEDISYPPLPEYEHVPPVLLYDSFVYFRRFFTDEMLEHIAYQTNLYATQQCVTTTFKTTPEEIMNFIAILLYMGVVPMPSLDDYWCIKTRVPQVATLMSSKRFRLLRRTIHFNDNSQIASTVDRFYKIRPIVNRLREEFLKIPQTPKQSIDEVMVEYKGNMAGYLRQYIRSKPAKWGYKLFSRASFDGIIHDMIMYQGQTTFPSHPLPLEEDEKMMPQGSQVVSVLARSMTSNEMTGIYADNYFTSLNLVRHLKKKNIRYTGTARENRIGKPCLRTNDDLGKASVKRGEVDYCSSSDDIVALKRKDNKVVTMLSSDRGVQPTGRVERYSKETKKKEYVTCPSVILTYNSNMGGIDKSDMLVQLYKTPMKSKRWYLRLFAYCIDVSIVNAWLLYRRDCKSLKQKWMSLKSFRLEIYWNASSKHALKDRRNLTRNHPSNEAVELPPPTFRGQRCEQPDVALRFEPALFHCPMFVGSRQTCKHCSVFRSNVMCTVCKLHLCLDKARNCFRSYHTPVA